MTAEGVIVSESSLQPTTEVGRGYGGAPDDPLVQIRELLRGLRYGSLNIIVQDGVVIQIDRTEKRRLHSRRANQRGQ